MWRLGGPAGGCSELFIVCSIRPYCCFKICSELGGNLAPPLISSTDGHRVLDTAFCPERIHAPLETERAAFTDGAIEDLTVVTNLLDDLITKVGRQPQSRAHVAGYTQQTLDLRIAGVEHLVDVFGSNTELLGPDQREQSPLDYV